MDYYAASMTVYELKNNGDNDTNNDDNNNNNNNNDNHNNDGNNNNSGNNYLYKYGNIHKAENNIIMHFV